MKKVLWFIQWKLKQFTAWQWVWMTGAFFFGAGITASGERRELLWTIAGAVMMFWFFYFMVWYSIKESWREFEAEQEKIVGILKDDTDRSSVQK